MPSPTPAKTIPNPRRLLILTPPTQSSSIIPPLLHTLSGVPVTEPPQTATQQDDESESQPETQAQSSESTPSSLMNPSFAGYTTHSPLQLKTKYYTAEVPIWVDEVPLEKGNKSSTSTPDSGSAKWKDEFLSEEAEIVREAVGALVVAVQAPNPNPTPIPRTESEGGSFDAASSEDVLALSALIRDIGAVKALIDEERGGMDVPGVFLLVGASGKSASTATATATARKDELELEGEIGEDADVPLSVGWWEDQLFDMGLIGWEVVEWDPLGDEKVKTKNKFGEYEGMPRVKEVLETHDWSAASGEDGLEDDLEAELLGLDEDGADGFGEEVDELQREMFGLRMAIERGGGDGDSDGEGAEEEENKVESMEALIMRMQSLRDMGSELPESERRKFAAKAVQDIMRDL